MGNCLEYVRDSSKSKRVSNSGEEGHVLKELLLQDENHNQHPSSSLEESGSKQARSEGTARLEEHKEEGLSVSARTKLSPENSTHSPPKPKVVRRLFENQSPSSLTPSGSQAPPADIGDDDSFRRKGGAVVDVNYCNEHELCVVGFTREEARAVINHRKAHGKYKRTTEVEAVEGISRDTWLKAKSKISLVPPSALLHLNLSQQKKKWKKDDTKKDVDTKEVIIILDSDDEADEVQVIGETRAPERNVKQPTVDLNRANVHELCCIGFDQATSQEVVNCRIRRQGFCSIDEIKSVSGVTDDTFNRVSPRLSLSPMSSKSVSARKIRKPKRSMGSSGISPLVDPSYSPLNGMHIAFGIVDNEATPVPANGAVLREEATSLNTPHSRAAPAADPFTTPTLVAAAVPQSPPSSARRINESIRVATWNLQCFSNKKASNSAVLEVVCTTILRHV